MPQYDYKISKVIQQPIKRRPSIQLSPSLEKPVYIITKDMNGRHILQLIDALEKEKIQYQLQQETSTLGFVLNQRFFVIVDNRYGEVTLGADFASSLMTIVGYPRIGRNKKNKYSEKPQGVIKCFKEFINAPDGIKMSKSLIKDNQPIGSEENGSRLRSKIQVRSIAKYKSVDEKQSAHSHNSLKQACKKECQRIKLIVLEDKEDSQYHLVCQYLFANENGQPKIQRAQNMEQIRKKTLLHTNKIKIFYMVSSRLSKQLISSIFIGQVLIFSTDKQFKLDDMIAEPKIYAIAYRKEELFKIVHKIGIDIDPLKSTFNSNFNQTSTFNDSKNSPFLLKNESNVKKQHQPIPIKVQNSFLKPADPKEMSKIDMNVSVISQKNETLDLNASTMSKGSSCNRKIKRLGKSKLKQNSQSKDKQQSKIIIKISNTEAQTQRKKTLKSIKSIKNIDYYQTASKSKKNLTFKENLIQSDRIKRIKSISKVGPEVFTASAQNQSTMTQNEYYTVNNKSQSSSRGAFFHSSRNSFLGSTTVSKNSCINGVFFRQFVPKLQQIAQYIKANPSVLFAENEKNAYVQSFVYLKQYDRFVRRLKNRLREQKQHFEQYNFIVLLRDEDFPQFQQYCRAKNQYYDEEDVEFASTFKQNFSCLSKTTTKMNIYVFIDSTETVKPEVVSFGRIEIYKNKLLSDKFERNIQKIMMSVKEKVHQSSLMNKDYLCA